MVVPALRFDLRQINGRKRSVEMKVQHSLISRLAVAEIRELLRVVKEKLQLKARFVETKVVACTAVSVENSTA